MGMRITNTMLVNNMSGYISKNLTKMQKYQYMIANGKKIELPSDDPVVAARSLKFRTDMAEVEQYKRNVEDANSWLETTEIALGNVGDVMQRVRELSVEAASEHIVDGDLLKINDEIKQLRTQLINIGNTTYAGRYIFSGFGTNTPLLNEDGEFINDVLNTEKIRYEIGIGDNMNVNVLGGDIFNAGDESIGAKKSTITGTTDITLPITIDGTNDQFSITFDEDSPKTVSIANGTYETMEELVNVMQNGVDLYLGSGKIDITYQDEKLKLSSTTKG
ncbi:MAG: flagellar hook-associated protein FlgL, partial [Clostridiales bacterium]